MAADAPSRRFPWILAAVVLLGLVVLAAVSAGGGDDEEDVSAASDDGVQTFDVPSADHVAERVDYPQTPPVGGPHNEVWMDCGAYEAPIFPELAVHSLEHGAVWITYDPNAASGSVSRLEELGAEPYVLVSPWDGELPAPVVASAWGAQLRLDDADDDRLEDFLETYRQAASAPEPGAPCTGGYSEVAS